MNMYTLIARFKCFSNSLYTQISATTIYTYYIHAHNNSSFSIQYSFSRNNESLLICLTRKFVTFFPQMHWNNVAVDWFNIFVLFCFDLIWFAATKYVNVAGEARTLVQNTSHWRARDRKNFIHQTLCTSIF